MSNIKETAKRRLPWFIGLMGIGIGSSFLSKYGFTLTGFIGAMIMALGYHIGVTYGRNEGLRQALEAIQEFKEELKRKEVIQDE